MLLLFETFQLDFDTYLFFHYHIMFKNVSTTHYVFGSFCYALNDIYKTFPFTVSSSIQMKQIKIKNKYSNRIHKQAYKPSLFTLIIIY